MFDSQLRIRFMDLFTKLYIKTGENFINFIKIM